MEQSDRRSPPRTPYRPTRYDRLYSRSLVRSSQSARRLPSAPASDGGGYTPLPPSHDAWRGAKDPWCTVELVASGT